MLIAGKSTIFNQLGCEHSSGLEKYISRKDLNTRRREYVATDISCNEAKKLSLLPDDLLIHTRRRYEAELLVERSKVVAAKKTNCSVV